MTALLFFSVIVQLDPIKNNRTLAAEDYHSWRQMDPRWGSISMNGTTVAKSGCLITALSMMARASDSLDEAALKNLGITSVEEFNPGVLAEAYNARNGFNYGGSIASWGTINKIIPQINFIKDSYLKSFTKEGIAAEIKEMMNQGYHIILNANWHWVYIEGVVGNDIYMIDPASDTRLLYDEYQIYGGNEYWALTCKNPPAPFTPPSTDTTTTDITTSETTDTTTTTTSETTMTTTTTEKNATSTTTTTTTTAKTTTSQTTTTTTTAKTTTSKTTTTTTTAKTTTSKTATTTTTSKTTTSTTTTTTTAKTTTSKTTTTTTTVKTTTKPINTTTTTVKTTTKLNTTTTITQKPDVTTDMPAGEYYNPMLNDIGIYASADMSGKPIAFVRTNEVVNAAECVGKAGHISGSDGFAGWIDLSGMSPVKEEVSRKRGDINGDGNTDMIDLGMLSEYLSSLEVMPDGVSIFTGCEEEAADINGDGKVNSGDVLVYLVLVCD